MSSHASPDYADASAPPRSCKNCGACLSGPYCSACGQHDIDYYRSFHHLFHDLLENLFHFEGKFFVTVAWLLAKPGRLTNEFIAGRRQSQLNPLRFYLFVSVLFFLGLALLNHGHLIDFNRREVDELQKNISAGLQNPRRNSVQLTPGQAQELARRITAATQTGQVDTAAIVDAVRQVETKSGALAAAAAATAQKADVVVLEPKPGMHIRIDRRSSFGRALEAKLASGELTLGNIWDALEHRAPTLLFLGVPLFALLLKSFYLPSRRYYIEHLIFSLHLHTWGFLAIMVGNGYLKLASLGPAWLSTFVGWAVFLWILWYVLASFRTVYAQSWRKTTFKVGLLACVHSFLLLMVALQLAFLTLYWLTLE